jgi:hypothetical protein
MKKFIYLLLLVSFGAIADECKVTTITIERNGKVESETATVCKEGQLGDTKIRIGDTILENEVGTVPEVSPKYFKYQNTQCRLFRESLAVKGVLRVNHGVICRTDANATNWLVVDKW